MSKRTNKIIAGAIGGMIGGTVMTLALVGTRRLVRARKISGDLDNVPVLEKDAETEDEPTGSLGKQLLSSAVLGGVYGALRSALRLPGILSGPAYGLVAFALSGIGLGPTMERTPGPWSERSLPVLPRLVTHTVYGTVTDLISERIEAMLS